MILETAVIATSLASASGSFIFYLKAKKLYQSAQLVIAVKKANAAPKGVRLVTRSDYSTHGSNVGRQ